jgi:RNA polymerase sigma factor (TIGR02999 family)
MSSGTTTSTERSGGNVIALLQSWQEGDKGALDRLVEIVHAELRRIARARLKGASDLLLQPTALVHEAYLRLVDVDRMTVHSRTHFLALAARLMRQILVDHARRRQASKRGGGLTITMCRRRPR